MGTKIEKIENKNFWDDGAPGAATFPETKKDFWWRLGPRRLKKWGQKLRKLEIKSFWGDGAPGAAIFTETKKYFLKKIFDDASGPVSRRLIQEKLIYRKGRISNKSSLKQTAKNPAIKLKLIKK